MTNNSPSIAAEFESLLVVDGYGVAFGPRVILADLHFEVATRGITVLMGPVGTGKSTFLRSIVGLNNPSVHFRQWGRVEYLGQIAGTLNSPTLVQQQARLLSKSVYSHLIDGVRERWDKSATELRQSVEQTLIRLDITELLALLDQPSIDIPIVLQRVVSILTAALSSPRLLMIDEPTAGLTGSDEHLMLETLKGLANTMPLLVVLHNQKQARRIASNMLLLAGGRIQAQCSVEEFFDHPPNSVVARFVDTGSCDLPSPDAKHESLSEDAPPPPVLPLAAQLAVQVTPEYRGPTGFRWVVPGKVAGTPMPGIVQSVDLDLAALRTVGVTMLITLTESDFPQDALRRHGLRNLHLPIRDREPPSVAQVKMLVVRMAAMLKKGEVLAVHCLAGLGRTGTVLASWLIQEGLTAQTALERIRKIESGYVQSPEQEEFLNAVEADLLKRI